MAIRTSSSATSENDNDDVEKAVSHRTHSKEESRGLVAAASRSSVDDDQDYHEDDDDDDRSTTVAGALAPIRFDPGRCIFYTIVTVFCLSSVSIFLPSRYSQQHQPLGPKPSSFINFTCPSSVRKGENYDASFESTYVAVSKQITSNMSQFAHEFRESKFDDWGRTYDQVKNGMFHWKSTRFTPLENGDSIYESACGIGLNLYMTLEILQETRNISHLVVYGNEYLQVSTDTAKAVMEQLAPAQAQKGVICAGDSTDLSFVPSNAFDLVYTGYISPILDPLHLNMTLDRNFEVYTQVCNDAHNDSAPYAAAQQVMLQQAQDLQNHWYDVWVQEMIRIAKPGKAVIVEQVSSPYCDAMFDWGGVPKSWWNASLPNWNVDPDSLYMEDDVIFPARYHVYLRKKAA